MTKPSRADRLYQRYTMDELTAQLVAIHATAKKTPGTIHLLNKAEREKANDLAFAITWKLKDAKGCTT